MGQYRFGWLMMVAIFILTFLVFTSLPADAQSPSPGPYDNALVHGTVFNMTSNGTMVPLPNYSIKLLMENLIPRSNLTDDSGHYEIWVPDSDTPYTLEVRSPNGVCVRSLGVNASRDQPVEIDIEITFEEQQGTGTTNWFTPENMLGLLWSIGEFLWVGLPWITIGILSFLGAVFMIPFSLNLFDRFKDGEHRFLTPEAINIQKQFFVALVLYVMGTIEYIMISLLFDLSFEVDLVARKIITAIGLILLLFFILRILLIVLRFLISYLRGKLDARGGSMIASRVLLILEFILKYVLILVFAFFMMLVILAALGFREMIISSAVSFVITKWGFVVFLSLIVIVAISIQRFSRTFFQDLRSHRDREQKMSSAMMFLIEKGVTFGLYTVLILIAIFTILSALGMGEIGQTLVLMISMIIGFVVSMAATGSIGNALSGVVIYSFRPLEKGDRVTVDVGNGTSVTGDVTKIDLMFTTIEDLESEDIKVPNNLVLATRIVNHTRSQSDGYAVVVNVTIGYDVPAERAKELIKAAALRTEGVLKQPKPFVLLTRFHDHAIEYCLRAYVDNAKAMYAIRSTIMVNMQKTFYSNGVEILSPLYHVKREEKMPGSDDISEKFRSAEAQKGEDTVAQEATYTAFAGLESLHAFDNEGLGYGLEFGGSDRKEG